MRHHYHHMCMREPPSPEVGSEWVGVLAADARAATLQRLGLTSSRLRIDGMRLRVALERDNPPLPPPHYDRVAVAVTLVSVDEMLHFVQRLYGVDDTWTYIWGGDFWVWTIAGDYPTPLPTGVQGDAASWVGLIRGGIPIVTDQGTLQAGGAY